jgi:hypothetical protein
VGIGTASLVMCVRHSVGANESDSCRADFCGSSCVRYSLKCFATFQMWTKIAGTVQEDDLDTVVGADCSVQWTNKQLTKRPARCKIITGSTTSRHIPGCLLSP